VSCASINQQFQGGLTQPYFLKPDYQVITPVAYYFIRIPHKQFNKNQWAEQQYLKFHSGPSAKWIL
jgi:hypothetical protein